jgi:hypothetical protein
MIRNRVGARTLLSLLGAFAMITVYWLPRGPARPTASVGFEMDLPHNTATGRRWGLRDRYTGHGLLLDGRGTQSR